MSMRWWMLWAIIACAVTVMPVRGQEQAMPAGTEQPAKFTNPDLPIEVRVADLISRLTLDEKFSQIQETSPALPRFNIEGFQWWSEGVHGLGRAGRATVFPVASGLAATWNVKLMKAVADATATEARAKYNAGERGRYHGIAIWAPSINLVRDPRWGRCQENWGEDPYFNGRMGVEFCKGLQGDDPHYLKTVATPKHFAVHSQETRRANTSFTLSMRLIREYYLPAFYDCYTEARAESVMAAFSGINGVPCTANKWLLTDLLRKEWGFRGVVVTDWGAVLNLNRSFGYVNTNAQAAAAALKAGVDVIAQPEGSMNMLRQAYQQKLITDADLDRALTNNFRLRFMLGLFDPKDRVPYTKIPYSAVGSPANKQLALQSSRESIVLLKNQPTERTGGRPILPLDRRRIESIAVFGPYLNNPSYGDYSGVPANPPLTPIDGISARLGGRIAVRTAEWGDRSAENRIAAESDLVIAVLSLNMRIEHEGHDRYDMNLPRDQQEFIERITAINPNVVVVLTLGSPVTINWIQEHVPAVMVLWYPGEQGGNALVDVLLGEYNPAGRLATTWYQSPDQLSSIYDYDITAGQGRTYLYFKGKPLYPFGYGLSYTTFDYSDLKLDRTTIKTDGKLNVSFKVSNTGQRDGEEVVQMYVRHVKSKLVQPIRQLKGFERRMIKVGQTETFTFPLAIRDMANWDEKTSGWFVEPGEYEIEIGGSSADIRLRQRFTVEP